MTTCKLLAVDEEGGVVRIGDIDAYDGTSVVDLFAILCFYKSLIEIQSCLDHRNRQKRLSIPGIHDIRHAMTSIIQSLRYRRTLSSIINNPRLVLLFGLLLTILFAWPLPDLRFRTSIYDLAVKDITEYKEYDAFKETFGNDEMILVVARARNVLDPEVFSSIDRLSRMLSEIPG